MLRLPHSLPFDSFTPHAVPFSLPTRSRICSILRATLPYDFTPPHVVRFPIFHRCCCADTLRLPRFHVGCDVVPVLLRFVCVTVDFVGYVHHALRLRLHVFYIFTFLHVRFGLIWTLVTALSAPYLVCGLHDFVTLQLTTPHTIYVSLVTHGYTLILRLGCRLFVPVPVVTRIHTCYCTALRLHCVPAHTLR